ncbi:hypothetical protein OJ996_08455 [Luteolibacter sp. GHJ8]|uniref:Transmembrane protein n=1 Tax=Luteolibacter rhizosphaerae TaxID=2989719 RepID=A0ABT3G191_9BACT|nr:hypothetical protein [Luteolibacter rhizosphaerae]MCW1913603.1 hypothetical protein [Luteolibacter rhizosphaerae]
MNTTPLPRLLRAFSILCIGFPGAILWIYGALVTVVTISSLSYEHSSRRLWFMMAGAAAGIIAVTVAYLMVIGNRILANDPRERLGGRRLAERLLWNLSIQFSAIFSCGFFFRLVGEIAGNDWTGAVVCLVLHFGFFFVWLRCGNHWTKLNREWLREMDEEIARAELAAADMAGGERATAIVRAD